MLLLGTTFILPFLFHERWPARIGVSNWLIYRLMAPVRRMPLIKIETRMSLFEEVNPLRKAGTKNLDFL